MEKKNNSRNPYLNKPNRTNEAKSKSIIKLAYISLIISIKIIINKGFHFK